MTKHACDNAMLALLAAHPEGLSAPGLRELLQKRHNVRLSQPTLSRRLLALRAQGLVAQIGKARATQYVLAGGRLRVAELRSQALHRKVAEKLVRDPGLKDQALERLRKLRASNPGGRPYHDRWEQLLCGEPATLLRVMTEGGETSDALRKASPFTTFLTESERERIFARYATGGRTKWTSRTSGFSSNGSDGKRTGNTSS